jgi:histidyl-tRNA synthetase
MAHKFQVYFEQFQTKCDNLAKNKKLKELVAISKDKRRRAYQYADAASKESDENQQSYFMKVSEYAHKEADYAMNKSLSPYQNWFLGRDAV